MKHCLLLLIVLLSICSFPADAAFRMRNKSQTEQKAPTVGEPIKYAHSNSLLSRFCLKNSLVFHRPRPYGNYDEGNPTFGIISFVSGLIGLACVALIAASASPAFIAIGLVAAIMAIVCGAKGLNKQMNGLAIAGLVLGIGEIVAGLVIVALVLAFLAAF